MNKILLISIFFFLGLQEAPLNAQISAVSFDHEIDDLASLRVTFRSYYYDDAGSKVYFTLNDTLSFEWVFGDGNTGSYPVVMHQYSSPGIYDVVLTVTNLDDPSDYHTTSPPETVKVDDSFEVPNVFTPDGDGRNDSFIIRSDGVTPLTITIFDRAGNVVYNHTSPLINWDGRTASGTRVKPGVYYYVITSSEPLYNKNGFVHIFYNE